MSLPANSLPLGQLIALDVFFPPVGAGLWWIMSRALAMAFQGGQIGEGSRRFINRGFWLLMFLGYFIAFGFTAFAYFGSSV